MYMYVPMVNQWTMLITLYNFCDITRDLKPPIVKTTEHVSTSIKNTLFISCTTGVVRVGLVWRHSKCGQQLKLFS